MQNYFTFIICLYIAASNATEEDLTFPPNFLIGTATSAYQIEGAWNFSDKGESLWDSYTHVTPEKIFDGQNGDIACDSFHKYKEDVQIMKNIGFQFYRFSMSWTRILPTGYANVISKDGVKYYHNLLDELEKNNIEPFVTLYHWDHPQSFQEIGGWTNAVMVDLFADYARVVFKEFGHRIKMFTTINEPNVLCTNSYSTGLLAPGLTLGKHTEYLCTHNILKAHARAFHIYNDEFRAQQNGKIGIVINCSQFYPKYENETEAAEIAYQFECGRYAHPIYSKNGDYPEVVKKIIAENSAQEGLKKSKLPTFSKKWIDMIRGSADYMGLNHYTAKLVEFIPRMDNKSYENDQVFKLSDDPSWPSTSRPFQKIVPEGFRDVLRKIKDDYENPPVYIMENGLSDVDTTEDNSRIKFYQLYLKALLEAIKKYGCNVKAYTVWSLLDTYEWNEGYSQKFGMVRVDFKHPNRTRTLKKSAYWFSDVTRMRKILPEKK